MYASSIPVYCIVSLLSVNVPCTFLSTLLFMLTTKYVINLSQFLNGDWLMVLLMGVNKVELNLTLLIYFFIYLTMRYSHRGLHQSIIVISSIAMHVVPLFNDFISLTNTKRTYLVTNDLSLSNGVVIIHPLLILIGYSLVLALLYVVFYVGNLGISDIDACKLHKKSLNFRKLSYLSLGIIILSIFLGSYWAHQELN